MSVLRVYRSIKTALITYLSAESVWCWLHFLNLHTFHFVLTFGNTTYVNNVVFASSMQITKKKKKISLHILIYEIRSNFDR